jgi:hypothetical protein
MTLADYLPFRHVPDLKTMRADRLMYGSDFPNLPYAWDREIQRILRLNLNSDQQLKLFGQNAIDFYRINMKAI